MPVKPTSQIHFTARFPTTCWTHFQEACHRGTQGVQGFLERVANAYWRPIYATIRTFWRQRSEDAKDLTQQFFLSLLDNSFTTHMDASKGRFRDFLRASLRNFMINHRKASSCIKRGGNVHIVSLDAYQEEEISMDKAVPAPSPDSIFDREWAMTLVAKALEILDSELKQERKEIAFSILVHRDLHATGLPPPSYDELARRFDISPQSVKSSLDLARRRLRLIFEELVRDYANSESEVHDEISQLLR